MRSDYITFDPDLRTLRGGGRWLGLSASESDCLWLLAGHEARWISRAEMLRYLVGGFVSPESDLIDQALQRLERRLVSVWPEQCAGAIECSSDRQCYRLRAPIALRSHAH